MTANQISYAKLREQERNDLAVEAETARHNQQMEWINQYANLIQQQYNAEVARSNLAREAETNRSNLARESETHRSNRVQENLTSLDVQTRQFAELNQERETRLHGSQFEETQRQNRINNVFNGIKTVSDVIFGGVRSIADLARAGSGLISAYRK